jgi:virginiamycin B lyase
MTAKKTKSGRNYSILTLIALLCFVQSDWAGSISEYVVPTSNSGPLGITMGPDNALWFVELYGNKISRIDPTTHAIAEYAIPTANSGAAFGITTGPDGAIWFTEGGTGDTPNGANRIGRIDPKTHEITDYPIPTPDSGPAYITSGSDEALWFTETFAGKIGRIDPKTHVITEYATLTPNSEPWGITSGPDGAIWFTESNANQIGRIDPKTHKITEYAIDSGAGCLILGSDGAFWFADPDANRIIRFDPRTRATTPYTVPTANSNPDIVANGPDGAIWFVEFNTNKIGRIDPATYAITEYAVSEAGGLTVGQDGALWFTEIYGNKIGRVFTNSISSPSAAVYIPLPAAGAGTAVTMGTSTPTTAGFGTLSVNSGNTPYGTAVFTLMNNNIVVSEAGVPASRPTTSARIFIDYRNAANAVPGRSSAGQININTGIAIVNPGYTSANITYILRDPSGTTIATGHGTSAARSHFACFIDQLKDQAADFSLPGNFQTTIQFGSLDIISDQPVSVLALRGTTNQRNEFLMTTTPVADLTDSDKSGSVYFPQLADGGGYTTSLILMNTSSGPENGKLEILDDTGAGMVVRQAEGATNSSFRYSIPSGGIFRFQTDGSPATANIGWIRVVPDVSNSTPVGSGIFGFNPVDMLVSESGIPSTTDTTHARIYVDLSNNHNTGLAVANLTNGASSILIKAFQTDGVTEAGTGGKTLSLSAGGHTAAFANQLVGLQEGFIGVLDISSTTPFAVLTLRTLANERNDFLMTTFPVADANEIPPTPIVFPQVADGMGYMTQFILLSAAGGAGTTLSFFSDSSLRLAIGNPLTLPPLPASGTVHLPDGFTLAPTNLAITAALGTVPVGANGSFTVMEPAGGGAATVLLTDANDNVIMLGHVDTGNPSFNEISPTSTAVEILFFATGAFTLPQDEWPDVYRVLAIAPETATLAGVISARMIVNPTAVGDMDPIIVNAINAAVTSLLSDLNTQSPRAVRARTNHLSKAEADTNNIDVQTAPSDTTPTPGYGVIASPSEDHLGIVLTNQSRINRYYFVYRTGYIPSNGKTTDQPKNKSPWTLVAEGLLPAVSGIGGGAIRIGIDGISYYWTGKPVWKEVNTPTIPLPLDPNEPDALANSYQVYVVGMGTQYIDPTKLKNNADFTSVDKTKFEMWLYQAVKEMVWPLLTKLLPLAKPDIFKDKAGTMLAINIFISQAGNAGNAWQSEIYRNPEKAWEATLDILKKSVSTAAGSKQVKDALYNLAVNLTAGIDIGPKATDLVNKFVSNLAGCIKAVDIFYNVVDVASIADQVSNSNDYNIWDTLALPGKMTLEPIVGTIATTTQTAPFSVKPVGFSPRTLRYVWGSSTYGKFTTGCGLVGNPVGCDGDQTAMYSLAGTTFPNALTDTFTVKVYDSNQKLLVTLPGMVKFTTVVINPSNPSVRPGDHQTFTVSLTTGSVPVGTKVDWSVRGCGQQIVTGGLNGLCSVTSTSSLNVDYLAPATPVTDFLDVQLTDASGKSLGSASTQINVGSGLIFSPVRPSLSLGAQQSFTVSGANGFVLPSTATYRWTLSGATGSGDLSGGGTSKTTTTPTVTYTAPNSCTVDTLTVQVIVNGKIVADASQPITVGIIKWTGTSYSVTNETSFPIYSSDQVELYEYLLDDTHAYFSGTSNGSEGSNTLECGSRMTPGSISSYSDGTISIALPNGCITRSVTPKSCIAYIPPMTLIGSSTQLVVPSATYDWDKPCDYATTRAIPFTLNKN